MTIKDLRDSGSIIFECISGSKAYGLDTPTSDTDIKGVFIAPKSLFYSLDVPEQVSDERNNVVFYELKKFIELLSKNNPNVLEMLNVPKDCILYKHPLYDKIDSHLFISKLCKDTFAGYALSQIKKARGLNKKILNPIPTERKGIIDFCYVVQEQGAIQVKEFLKSKGFSQENCGLVAIPHMHDIYGLYYSTQKIYSGLVRDQDSFEVSLSSVPKGEKPIAIMSFNKDGYSKYCKDYKEYHEWETKRNPERYLNTLSNGKNYDAKNMMHTFRLLDMAEEIGKSGQIVVRRPNRDILLKIKNGEFEYKELIKLSDNKLKIIEEIYSQASLPLSPYTDKINRLLFTIREEFYKD